jgi:hypothetical protein
LIPSKKLRIQKKMARSPMWGRAVSLKSFNTRSGHNEPAHPMMVMMAGAVQNELHEITE